MNDNFRQEVEDILERYKGFKIYERNAEDIVGEICAAAERMAERMPYHSVKVEDKLDVHINEITEAVWKADQAYIRKELGGKE